MSDRFYRAFEERLYAPRSVIKQLRKQYLPFSDIVCSLYPGAETYDIGCGRGEWLELMLESGMAPFGVDLDDGMLQGCREQKLPAQQGDAVAYLAALPDESQAIISAFHVVEHISFDQLRTVVSEALRVLKPGGLLIMETPNPENIVVATCNFYLDPTHQRPIPPRLLSFLPEYYGYARTKILRFQQSIELATNESPTLNDVLAGASPDYAVIAQKAAPAEILARFEQAFGQEYGLSLTTLAERYDASIDARISQAEARVTQSEARVTELLNSTSWRITAPMRWAASAMRGLALKTLKNRLKIFLQHAVLYIGRRPWLKNMALRILSRFPGLKSRLFRLITGIRTLPVQSRNVPTDVAHLAPRAREIHADLKTAIERHQRKNG